MTCCCYCCCTMLCIVCPQYVNCYVVVLIWMLFRSLFFVLCCLYRISVDVPEHRYFDRTLESICSAQNNNTQGKLIWNSHGARIPAWYELPKFANISQMSIQSTRWFTLITYFCLILKKQKSAQCSLSFIPKFRVSIDRQLFSAIKCLQQ